MWRRRSFDFFGDIVFNLGSVVDEFMRYQFIFKIDVMIVIIKLFEEICNFGRDFKYICQKLLIQKVDGIVIVFFLRFNYVVEEVFSEDEEEEEVQVMQSFNFIQ